jgi:hypothetical protein
MADADFLTGLQNAVQAINTLAQTWSSIQGVASSPAYASDTVITIKQGRVAYVSIIAGGSAAGYIHNCQTVAAAADSNKLMLLPQTTGIYAAACNFNNGLVIKPGAGQLVSVTYSLAQVQTAAS